MEPSPAPVQEPNTPSAAPAPITDVVPAPAHSAPVQDAPATPAAAQPNSTAMPKSKAGSEADSSVRMAIIATVIIVITLSALAVLAYMSST